jgi:hypothetical protein
MQTPNEGFKTPDGFEALLKSQLLKTVNSQRGFIVPNAYEDELKQRLLEIPQSNKSNKWRWLTIVAASIVIISGVSIWFVPQSSDSTAYIDFTNATLEEVSYYDLIDNPQLFEEIIDEPDNNNNYDDYILFES